jgi:hypothetical protein
LGATQRAARRSPPNFSSRSSHHLPVRAAGHARRDRFPRVSRDGHQTSHIRLQAWASHHLAEAQDAPLGDRPSFVSAPRP